MKSQLTWLTIAFTLSTSVPALAQTHYATPVPQNQGPIPPDRRAPEGRREREERERREREEQMRRERAERERAERERRERAEHERWEREHNPNVHGASPVNR